MFVASSHEATAQESPARECRESGSGQIESRRDGTWAIDV